MSYDLMVFRPQAAPRTRPEFISWYYDQTRWSKGNSYDDPAVTSDNLQKWFMEMIVTYPPMNGPYAQEENEDDEFVTDYSIGQDVIYVAFSWTMAEQAYEKMKILAEKHKVGFFDASADKGDILFPGDDGKNRSIDKQGNLSSIQQIKNSASPGQEGASVKEIIYSKAIPQILEQYSASNQRKSDSKRCWWKKLLGLK
jgi:hypothetical protein